MQPFGTILLLLLSSAALVLLGHVFRLLRWEQFIRIYEYPQRRSLLRAMAGGYAVNFLLPFHVGDFLRAALAGRKMKTGTGFAFATVIMDRFLDVWVVALLFGGFRLAGLGGAAVLGAARYYLVFALLLAAALVLVVLLRDLLKRCCLAVCSIFNDTIKLDGLVFCWSLINTFKDLRRVNLWRLLLNTVLMWGAYLASYAVLGQAIIACGGAGGSFGLVEVFNMLFGVKSVDVTSLGVAGSLGLSDAARGLVIAWFLLPLAVMFAAPLLPEHLRAALNGAAEPIANREAGQENYLNLLPQVDPRDRGAFLNQYFSLQNKAYVAKFIEINQNITILQDYSAGSNATTMLCTDGAATFYRKYAFGADGAKLAEQLAWLRRNAARLPLCEILREGTGEGYCWYDMTYSGSAVGLFRYIHSNPPGKSAAILRSVLRALDEQLYRPTARPADPEKIEEYLNKKMDANLEKIRDARILKELWNYDRIWINGRSYRNLKELGRLFDHNALRTLFAADPVADIHGDLTVENIICRTDVENPDKAWYIIDPNTGNLHDSPYLDYGKLLQSLHGGYEFMMMTPRCTVQENHIDFQLTRSAAYDTLFEAVCDDLRARCGAAGLHSILAHELIHWLRLMPYKLNKDKKRAPCSMLGLSWWPTT